MMMTTIMMLLVPPSRHLQNLETRSRPLLHKQAIKPKQPNAISETGAHCTCWPSYKALNVNNFNRMFFWTWTKIGEFSSRKKRFELRRQVLSKMLRRKHLASNVQQDLQHCTRKNLKRPKAAAPYPVLQRILSIGPGDCKALGLESLTCNYVGFSCRVYGSCVLEKVGTMAWCMLRYRRHSFTRTR